MSIFTLVIFCCNPYRMKIAPAKLFAGRGNVIMLHSLHTFITLFTHIYSYLYKNVMYLNNTNYNKKHSTINPLKYLFLYGLTLHTYCKQMQICSVFWPAAVARSCCVVGGGGGWLEPGGCGGGQLLLIVAAVCVG